MRSSALFILAVVLALGLCSCDSANATRPGGAFEYRELYTPYSLGKDAKAVGLNSVDYDWGIWGHNLSSVLPAQPSLNVYAKVGNETHTEQFCFSSEQLYNYIVEFITNRYDDADSARFAIVPNDNQVVCLCEKCTSAGNTDGNASPAVFKLVERLCERFPSHTFFVTDYLTTSEVPTSPLPPNAGVLVSAINFPRTAHATTNEKAFMDRVAEWQKNVNHVYVWDYISNFDDYFTPIPVFSATQHRLQEYRNAGVKGIFLNGSGPDYQVFGRLMARVLDEMTYNPDIDYKDFLKELCDVYYPTAGEVIYQFMMDQEAFFHECGKALPMYDGIRTEMKTYLPQDRFLAFYDVLVRLEDEAQGQEKDDLDKMIGAMSLTWLEIARNKGDITGYEEPLSRLRRLDLDRGIQVYNESGWSLSDYIRDFEFAAKHAAEMEGKNLIKGKTIINKTPLDEEYTEITMATNGILGIPSNYHSGNLISSADPALVLEVPYVQGAKTLRVSFVDNKRYHIGLPEFVELSVEGFPRMKVTPQPVKEHMKHAFAEFELPAGARGPLTLRILKSPEQRTIAIDEIELF